MAEAALTARPSLRDACQRRITYLRVSITDRCNLRCTYCMPAEGLVWKPREDILSFDEIVRVATVAVELGVRKIRITGGEPLVRHGCAELISRLHALGVQELCLTTNGIRFAEQAEQLKRAGLTRVNLSLDTLDPEKYRQLTRGGDIQRVWAAIEAALALDLQPRLNVVAMRGFNEDELPALAALTVERPITVRFIELMPFAHAGEACTTQVAEPLPLEAVRAALGLPAQLSRANELPLLNTCGPAEYARLPGALGEVGFIAAMHEHICDRCNRIRLTADGWLRPCLLGDERVLVRQAARYGTTEDVREAFDQLMALKPQAGRRQVQRHEAMATVGG